MNFIKKILENELISGTLYIFLGTMVANVMAFLINLFLARNLSYADYAIFASILSILTLSAIPATSISNVIVKFATDHFINKDFDRLKALYLIFFKFIIFVCFGIVLASLLLTVPLSSYLKISNYLYVVIAGLIISAFYLNALNVAFLQSLLKFGYISILSAAGGIVKLIFGVLLVFLGYKAFGGLWSLFFMTFASFIFGFLPLKSMLSKSIKNTSINIDRKEILNYAIPTFTTVLFLTSFTSIDVILVKHFFDAQTAGFYAGLSLIGKVIFYFTLPIPMVMFPLLIKRQSTGKDFINLFYLSLVLVILPSVAITAFYYIRPAFVINLFLGGREYLSVSNYLGFFGFYLTIFSLVNVCVNFFLSLNESKVSYLVVFAALMQIVLIYLFHSSFYQVIGVSILVSLLLLLSLILLFYKDYGHLRKKDNLALINNPNL
jgi:O-antigen/teichoic acid export membrane protein